MASYNGGGREEVGVVAALLQVHDDVEQRHLVSSSFGVQGLKVFRQDEFVVLPARQITGYSGSSANHSTFTGVFAVASRSLTSAWD